MLGFRPKGYGWKARAVKIGFATVRLEGESYPKVSVAMKRGQGMWSDQHSRSGPMSTICVLVHAHNEFKSRVCRRRIIYVRRPAVDQSAICHSQTASYRQSLSTISTYLARLKFG